jgi:hypothetical protein
MRICVSRNKRQQARGAAATRAELPQCGYCSGVSLFLSAALSVVAVALSVAAFVVPYIYKRREWSSASPEARAANLTSARARKLGLIALLALVVVAALALRALS